MDVFSQSSFKILELASMWNGASVRRNKCWCKRPKYLLHDLLLGLSRRNVSFQSLSVARNGKVQNRLACIIRDDVIWA
jgi:hypothetical protein